MPQLPTIPHDSDAEEILLGNCLLSESLEPLADLGEEHFYSKDNQKILGAMRGLRDAARPLILPEVVGWLQDHSNGVSPSYVSGLTDIVKLSDATLEHYRGRLRDALEQRAAMQQAATLAELGTSGATVEEIHDRAQKIVEQTTPKPAKTPAPKGEYSLIPQEAWHGATELYRQAMAKTCSASDNFHFAGFLTVIGSQLGKSVYYDDGGEELYPNLFTLIVGAAGWAKKDSALRRAMRFSKELDETLTMVYGLSSIEGFIDRLVHEQKELQTKGLSPTPLRILLRMSELKSLIAKASRQGTADIIPRICEAYDCPPFIDTPGRTHYARADEPVLSVYACTSPGWLRSLQVEDLESGFGSRMLFVPGDPKPLWPKKHRPDPLFFYPLVETVKKRLDAFRTMPRAFSFTPDAEAIWNKWVIPHDALRSDNDTINLMAARDPTTCIKTALIHAALDDAQGIEPAHLHAAIAFVEWLHEVRFPLFAGHGMTPTAEIDQKIIKQVKKTGGMWWRDIRRGLQRIDHEVFEKRMRSLVFGLDPPLKVTPKGLRKKPWVTMNE